MARLVQLQPIDPRATAGERATYGEAVSSGFNAAYTLGSVAENRRHSEIYGGWRQVFDRAAQGYMDLPPELSQPLVEQGYSPDEETLSRLMDWAQENGTQYGIEITPDMDPATVMQRRDEIFARDQARLEREQEVLSRASPFSRNVGGLIGGVGAEFLDPINLMTLPAGAPARVGLLGTVLIEAGLNAGIEAADTPSRNAIAEKLGQEGNSVWENAAMGALFGGALAGVVKGAEIGVGQLGRIGRLVPDRRALIEAAEATGSAEAQLIAQQLRRDLEDEQAATSGRDGVEVREHIERAQQAAQAAHEGGFPDMPDRPVFAQPRSSILNGEIEEVDPRELLVQPDVFQFKSDIVAEGGVTSKLVDVTEWAPERAGIVLVYEYADGTRAIADGHQRTALANRIMAQTGQEITMAAKVFREVDDFTAEDIRVLAALKNIAEAADGMTTAMARDAARVLRVRPDAIDQLPAGPGIARAQALSRLSDEAFDMFINEVVPERFAELVGRMVEDPQMHSAMMQLLNRTRPDTTAQAESILAQALQAPVSREITADLFGEQEIVESLYLERAKVLERAMRLMRDDRSVFRTLDERADRIQGAGENRLDAATNKQIRQQTDQALASVQKLAHRAGPISEALNDGAKAYKENGRIKDAAQRVVDAVKREIERNGFAGAGAGANGRNAEPTAQGAEASNHLEGFDDPISGDGARAQIANTRIQPAGEIRIERLPDLDPVQAAKLEGGLKAAQAFRDVDDLMERGAKNHNELTQEIEVAAQSAGVTARAAPLKGRARTEQKIRDKYAGDLNRVTDVARGGVDAATPEAADRFVEILAQRYRVLDEGWNVVDGGYFDRKLTVVFDDGQLGEVQLWVPGMFEVKEAKGHKLYEIYRDPSRSEPERKKALSDMEALYSGVMEKLPSQWRQILDQDSSGIAPPKPTTTDAKTSSSKTSGEPSSRSTSDGDTSDQVPSDPSNNIEPGSGSTAGIDRSTKNIRMGDTSTTDISAGARVVKDPKTERTSAGEQSLFDGIEPITERTRMDERAAQPMGKGGGAADETEIGGLFDPSDPSRFDLFDAVPVSRGFDEDGNEIAIVKSRADLAAELDADDEAVAVLDICVKG